MCFLCLLLFWFCSVLFDLNMTKATHVECSELLTLNLHETQAIEVSLLDLENFALSSWNRVF